MDGKSTGTPAIILNNVYVLKDWSLGIQHFSFGLYNELLQKLPEKSWKILVSSGQKAKYRGGLDGINLSYYEQRKMTSSLLALFIRNPLDLIKYSWTSLKRHKYENDLNYRGFVNKLWWEEVERGACLEYCPSQVTPMHSRLPLVLTCHDLHPWNVPWQYPDPEGLKSIVTDNLKKAKSIIVSWPRPFQEIAERFPEHQDKMFMVPLPIVIDKRIVNNKEIVHMKKRYGLDGRFVLYASRLQPHKNHQLLLSAFAIAKKKLGNLFLVCPGSAWSEEFRQELLHTCVELGIEKHVCFPGYISTEELQVLYAMCDAVVAPTFAEAASGTMIEGFAHAKPVACSAIPPLKTFIEWIGGHVCYFDPKSADDMSNAIIEVLENPEPYRVASLKTGDRLRTFTWSRTAGQYIDIFNWVLNGCKRESRPEWATKPITFQE